MFIRHSCRIRVPLFIRIRERHRSGRTGWLRASVLGANDGILSTSSLGKPSRALLNDGKREP